MIDERGAVTLFIRRLYAKGKLSIRDAYRAAAREEAEYGTDLNINMLEAHCSLPVAQAVAHLLEEPETRRVGPGVAFPDGPILVPAEDLSAEQAGVLEQWRTEGHSWPACGFDEGPTLVLDSIPWKFGPGWRKLYPEIPCC
jgi:hypothetical protein